jgi:hypothetical protein
MTGAIIGITVCLLFSALSLAAQEQQVFKGVCVKVGAKYALSDPVNKAIYNLDDQLRFKTFADQSVVVIGSLDKTNGMIHVSDVMRALSPKVMKAVLVYVDCVDCPGGMAAAERVTLQEVAGWKRFYLVSDRHRADLIFLFFPRAPILATT